MEKRLCVHASRSAIKLLKFAPAAAASMLLTTSPPAIAQDPGVPAFAPGMIRHMQAMRAFEDHDQGAQPTPNMISRFDLDPDPTGMIGTFQPGGATFTANNAFFQNLGTNGRTCFTCHQRKDGWSVSAASIARRFEQSAGADPIFRLVDGATCPSADVANLQAKQKAYKLLIDKGLIRIGLPLPDAPKLKFEVMSVVDPYNCTTNPTTGLTSPTSGIVSVYRRPLPSTNLGFLSAFMWDGREPSLQNQAVDATLGHAQADSAPTPEQVNQIVAFETGIFTAQALDKRAAQLQADGANGGPVALSLELSKFYIGVNDPLGGNPNGIPFTPNIFDIYRPWLGLPGQSDEQQNRKSVARGEELFNGININITGVGGLNDKLGMPSIPGFCGTCHDTPNVGNHSVKAPLNIGVANAGANSPPGLDISDLPVFTLKCNDDQSPLKGQTFVVTDPGRALITGACEDIGKLKGPILRGLAGRAPYFHNGSAATLMDVIKFYDQRFGLSLTDQQMTDLVNFLNTL
jgi:cytochrome c peroxidase